MTENHLKDTSPAVTNVTSNEEIIRYMLLQWGQRKKKQANKKKMLAQWKVIIFCTLRCRIWNVEYQKNDIIPENMEIP